MVQATPETDEPPCVHLLSEFLVHTGTVLAEHGELTVDETHELWRIAAEGEARIEKLEKALKPFVEECEQNDAEYRKVIVLCGLASNEDRVDVTHPAVRHAREALNDRSPPQR